MKRYFSFLVFSVLMCNVLCAQQYQHAKEATTSPNTPLADFAKSRRQLFNFDWEFVLGKDSTFTSGVRKLSLPHDFQFEQPWTEDGGGARGFKPMCEGWYRKTFRADEQWKGKQVLLDFGGVMYVCDVYLNGKKIASAEYGYLGFEVDVTRQLKYGEDNVLMVWASTGPKNGSRWYTGGGIFRDVYLKLQNPTHIARHGVFVTTPKVTASGATVSVMAEVDGWKNHGTRVRTTLVSPDGKVLGSSEGEFPKLTKQTCTEVTMPEISVENPQLWSPDTPCLYTAQVVVEADGFVVDSVAQRFGIRSLEYSPEFGFKLNGKKFFVKGIANHHDMGALGVASFDRGIIRQMETLKRFGFNAIRCSHNPYSESFTQIADSLGLVIVDELIDKWSDNEYWGGRKPFMSIWQELIPEWIKRDRNSPSVILWSLGNELQIRPDWSGYKTNDWGITTYRIFDQMVKRYDPTRKTTVAMFPSRAGAIREEKEFKTYMVPPELACVTEVSSFNYQWDAYPKYFECKPDMILFQSEAVTNQLVAPFYGMDRKRTVGLAYWGAIEYWGESNKWPKKGWNYSYFRHTLDAMPQAYLMKSVFEPEVPMVRIGVMNGGESVDWNDVKVGQKTYADHWTHKKGTKQQVATFTNGDEVELIVNGKSLGRLKNDTTDVFNRNIVRWQDVPYADGGSIEAVAYRDGKEWARQRLETAGEVARLVIEPEQQSWTADGMDLLYLNVRAVDKNGRTVPGYAENLKVSVEGEASLLAIDNADHFTDLLFNGVDEKPMMLGKMQVILRSTRTAGKVTLTCTSGKMKKKIVLNTK